MYVIKDTKCWEKTKNQKKKLKPLPSLHSHPIPLIFLPLPSWSGPPSALSPGKGRKPGGGVALGTCSRSSPPLPVPGWVGCQVYLCTSCTLINLCKSPTPAPPCFCAFAHSPQTPRASPIPLPLAQGSGMDRGHLVWNQQGVPLKGPSPPPSQSVWFTIHQGELALPDTRRW